MLASSSLMVRLMTRRPKPCRSAKPGWAPIETPFSWQSFTVSTITVGSLAWKPQATLADFTIFRISASLPITEGPKLSPRSELMLTKPELVAVAMGDSSLKACSVRQDRTDACREDVVIPSEARDLEECRSKVPRFARDDSECKQRAIPRYRNRPQGGYPSRRERSIPVLRRYCLYR